MNFIIEIYPPSLFLWGGVEVGVEDLQSRSFIYTFTTTLKI